MCIEELLVVVLVGDNLPLYGCKDIKSLPTKQLFAQKLTVFFSISIQFSVNTRFDGTKIRIILGISKYLVEPDEKTMVLVGFFKNKYQLEWIERNEMYNTRAGLDAGSIALSEDMISAKYLLLFNPKIGTRFYRMKAGGPIAISSSDKRLKEVEGYKPSKPIYLAFRFETKPVEGFEEYDWSQQSFVSYLKINFKPHTIPLSELKKLLGTAKVHKTPEGPI